MTEHEKQERAMAGLQFALKKASFEVATLMLTAKMPFFVIIDRDCYNTILDEDIVEDYPRMMKIEIDGDTLHNSYMENDKVMVINTYFGDDSYSIKIQFENVLGLYAGSDELLVAVPYFEHQALITEEKELAKNMYSIQKAKSFEAFSKHNDLSKFKI